MGKGMDILVGSRGVLSMGRGVGILIRGLWLWVGLNSWDLAVGGS